MYENSNLAQIDMRKCIVKARLTTTNKTLRRGLCLSAARLLFLAIKNQKISGTRKRASTAAYAWVLLVVSVCELIGIHQIRNPRSVLICFKPHPSRAPTSSPFLPKPWQQFYFIACAPRRKKILPMAPGAMEVTLRDRLSVDLQ